MKLRLRVWRRLCQALVALGFVVVPLLNVRDMTTLSGNLLSLNFFGLTFADPLAFAQTFAAGSPDRIGLAGAGLVLLIALVLGRIFCGWMCPYGLASELIFLLREGRKPTTGVRLRAFAVRAGLTALGLFAVLAILPEPLLNQLSMPGWYTRALQHMAFYGLVLHGALIFPALLLLEGLTGRRFWCRYMCPQAVLLALAAAVPLPGVLRIRFARRQCACPKNDRPCRGACSLNLDPREASLAQRLECTNCGDCVDACTLRGKALRLSFRE